LITHPENSVNDFNFSPFNANLLASACQDGSVALWQITDGGLTQTLSTPTASFPASDKRLLTLEFNPLADNVILTVDAGKQVKLFDVEQRQAKSSLPDVHKGLLTNVSWNGAGSLLATSCKDKTLRIFDPRANKCAGETPDHPGAKGARCLWLANKDIVFSVGFGKGSERQFSLFDPRKFAKALTLQTIDNSSSSLLPFYDNDNSVLFLGGKGDGNIRLYEVVDTDPYIFFLNEYKAKEPQSGLATLPKQSCNVMKCEIMKFVKITPQGLFIPLRFEVPRAENQFFQEDLFPPTWDGKPSMTSRDWFSGASKPANLVSLNPAKQ